MVSRRPKLNEALPLLGIVHILRNQFFEHFYPPSVISFTNSFYIGGLRRFDAPRELLTDVTRLNFFEVARAAFFSVLEIARAGLVH